MTKDRARKQAARDRAAATGERYVVARREVGETPSHDGGVLHELTHRVPGVPEHVEGGLQARTERVHRTRPVRQYTAHENPARTKPVHQNRQHTQPDHGEPRVLVGWQNRIARLFSAK